MEKIAFVSQKHGRKTRHGYVDTVGGISFAVCPVRADRMVYFGIPGAHEDFLQVYAELWDGSDAALTGAIENAIGKIEGTNPAAWAGDFSARFLEKVRAKTIKAHKEYTGALLDEHLVYKGEPWK